MNEIGEGKELNKLLSSFSCEMDKDIEFFYINVQLNLKNFQRRVCYIGYLVRLINWKTRKNMIIQTKYVFNKKNIAKN